MAGIMKCGSRKGFTLMEVLIVVVIIAILAGLLIPRFSGQREKAEAMEAVAIMGVVRQGMLAYRHEYGSYPELSGLTNIENTLGVSATAPKYLWVFSTDTNGTVTATRAGVGTLTLSPEGAWNGTAEYSPTTGRYWPHLS